MAELPSSKKMGDGVGSIKVQFTLDIKHCLMTKSHISQGPSEHQQKRARGRRSGPSRIPWVTRNSAMDSMTSGKDGASSVWSCGGCQMSRGLDFGE